MPKTTTTDRLSAATPRKFLGGRADNTRANSSAPQWTALAASAAANATIAALSAREGLIHGPGLLYRILTDDAIKKAWERALTNARATEATLARRIFDYWRQETTSSTGTPRRLNRVRSRLGSAWRTMIVRARVHGTMGRIFIAHTDCDTPTPATALGITVAPDPQRPERRPRADGRVMTALAKWDWSRFEGIAFLVFERAESRLRHEFEHTHGCPDPDTVERLLHREDLPTALQHPSDHYLVVREAPGAAMPDVAYMAIDDAATAGGIPSDSPLRKTLCDVDTITAVQAVAALGEATHGQVVDAVIGVLQSEGSLPTLDIEYATAFSGADVTASIIHHRTGGRWSYRFASEPKPCRRRVLLQTWAHKGLSTERLHEDACGTAARRESTVDLFVITPACQAFSRRNHSRTPHDQARSLANTHAALDYVRLARPRTVMAENVDVPELRGHMDMLLLGIPGYWWRRAIIDPREVGGFAARQRCYWIGVRI